MTGLCNCDGLELLYSYSVQGISSLLNIHIRYSGPTTLPLVRLTLERHPGTLTSMHVHGLHSLVSSSFSLRFNLLLY